MKFRIRYSGSVGHRMLDFQVDEVNSTRAHERMLRELPSYWPIYYIGDFYHDDEEGRHISRVHTKVVASTSE